MIKILYMASIPFFVILILIFITLILTYKPPVVNKEATIVTENLIRNNPSVNLPETSIVNNMPPVPSEIWKNNIFDPTRATLTSASAGSVSLKDITLVGIFDYGAAAGAIFLMNSNQNMSGGSYYPGEVRHNYGTPQQPGKDPPPKPKMVFLVGERLPNGFLLKSIGRGSVVLQRGDGSYPLAIQFADDDSSKRIADMQRNNAPQQQARIIEAGQEGSNSGSNSGTNSSNIVIRNTPDAKQNN